jgi:hypothetical protein
LRTVTGHDAVGVQSIELSGELLVDQIGGHAADLGGLERQLRISVAEDLRASDFSILSPQRIVRGRVMWMHVAVCQPAKLLGG